MKLILRIAAHYRTSHLFRRPIFWRSYWLRIPRERFGTDKNGYEKFHETLQSQRFNSRDLEHNSVTRMCFFTYFFC